MESKTFLQQGEIVACDECDLLIRLTSVDEGQKACCPRCSHVITQKTKDAKSKVAALSLASLIFLIFSLPYTFLSFESKGNERVITLLDSVTSMFNLNFDVIGLLLLLTTIVIPGMFLIGILVVIFSVAIGHSNDLTKHALKGVFHLLDWNMAEIFLIGILVSFIKIASMANVNFGLSFGAYVLFIIFLVATANNLDRFQAWRWVRQSGEV